MRSALRRRRAWPLLGAVALGCAVFAGPGAGASQGGTAARSAKCSKATTITLDDSRFSPPALCLKPGTRVTWKAKKTNRDYHTVTVQAGSPYFNSGDLYPGDSFSKKLRKGTFVLYCIPHPEMSQTIKVK